MKNQMFFIAVIILFSAAVIAGAILLSAKGQEESADHSTHPAQDGGKLSSLIGKAAPDFTLESFDNRKITLSEQKGKKVVLFFTEGVMCYPACWNQIAAFGKDDTFKKDDTVVLSIVVDTKNEWKEAINKMPELGSTTVLFDTAKTVSREYGMLSLPSSMHKGQYPGHTYVILDKTGVVQFVKDDPQMAVRNDELKAELAKLN